MLLTQGSGMAEWQRAPQTSKVQCPLQRAAAEHGFWEETPGSTKKPDGKLQQTAWLWAVLEPESSRAAGRGN